MRSTIISITIVTLAWFAGCSGKSSDSSKNIIPAPEQAVQTTTVAEDNSAENNNSTGEVVVLTKQSFIDKVYDYETNPSKWTFKGDKPCVIDFYADWCRPCKMIAPIMVDLAKLYEGKVDIYKINTDKEREVAQFFGIRSIPAILFCPVGADPQMMTGAYPKEQYVETINSFLLNSSSK